MFSEFTLFFSIFVVVVLVEVVVVEVVEVTVVVVVVLHQRVCGAPAGGDGRRSLEAARRHGQSGRDRRAEAQTTSESSGAEVAQGAAWAESQ